MCDLICDVINSCVWSCDTCKSICIPSKLNWLTECRREKTSSGPMSLHSTWCYVLAALLSCAPRSRRTSSWQTATSKTSSGVKPAALCRMDTLPLVGYNSKLHAADTIELGDSWKKILPVLFGSQSFVVRLFCSIWRLLKRQTRTIRTTVWLQTKVREHRLELLRLRSATHSALRRHMRHAALCEGSLYFMPNYLVWTHWRWRWWVFDLIKNCLYM